MEEIKNALLVSGIYSPDIGGPATYIPKLARVLSQNGWKIRTLSLTDKYGLHRPVEPWNRFFILRGIPLPLRIISTAVFLRLIQKKNTKVFANGLYEEVAIGRMLGGNASVAKVVGDPIWERYRNKNPKVIEIDEFNKLPLGFIYKWQRMLLVWSLNKFDKVTVPSPQLAKLVEAWGVITEVSVISNGIQMTEVTKTQKKYDVVTVSRLVPWKNIDALIEVCKNNGLTLAVVGSGPEETRLKNLANNPKILFFGELPHAQVRKILDQSRVFCLLSSYEGLSHALLEAMGSHIPIVASDIPGNKHVINHLINGLLVDYQNHNEISEAISQLLRNQDLAKKLSDSALADVKSNYSETTQIAKMVTLIEE